MINSLEQARLLERETEKRNAITVVEEALAGIEEQEREADHWERVFLAEAIGAIFRGCYGLACTDVAVAMTPSNHRSPVPMLPQDPFYDRYNIALLRDALSEAKAESVRPFPHHGPIVFIAETSS
jgi:hypothetical protein